jgi:hypothetical protein
VSAEKKEKKPTVKTAAVKTAVEKTAKVAVKSRPKPAVRQTAIIEKQGKVKPRAEGKVKAEAKKSAAPKTVPKKVAAAKVAPSKIVAEKKTKPAVKAKATAPIQAKAEKGKAVAVKKEPAIAVKPPVRPAPVYKKAEKKKEEALPRAERVSVGPAKASLKIFLPEEEVEADIEHAFFKGLPEEYGENSVIAMVVDPNTVFVDWEMVPKDVAGKEGDLGLRFYDVTGIEFNNWKANAYFDIPITQRVGSGFFSIHMPGRDIIVAVGIMSPDGGFMPIVRSDIVSFPALLTFDEFGIVQKLFASGVPVGY